MMETQDSEEERDAVKKDVKQCETMYPCGGHCVT